MMLITTSGFAHIITDRPVLQHPISSSMSLQTRLVYRELAEGEIRQIQILPGEWDDTIACLIEYAPLPPLQLHDVGHRFTALSYAGGDLGDSVDFTVNGDQYAVTWSLNTALRRLRSFDHSSKRAEDTQPPSPVTQQLDNADPGVAVELLVELDTFRLWADSICINQADPKERQRQIRRMKRIYGGADEVLV